MSHSDNDHTDKRNAHVLVVFGTLLTSHVQMPSDNAGTSLRTHALTQGGLNDSSRVSGVRLKTRETNKAHEQRTHYKRDKRVGLFFFTNSIGVGQHMLINIPYGKTFAK